jgi:hypothetical protein
MIRPPLDDPSHSAQLRANLHPLVKHAISGLDAACNRAGRGAIAIGAGRNRAATAGTDNDAAAVAA